MKRLKVNVRTRDKYSSGKGRADRHVDAVIARMRSQRPSGRGPGWGAVEGCTPRPRVGGIEVWRRED